MEKLSAIICTYQHIIEESERGLQRARTHIRRISLLRVVLFVEIILSAILFWNDSWIKMAIGALIPLFVFIYLITLHNRWFYRKDFLKKKIEINQQELRALDHDFNDFDGGKEYINPAHLYSFDLDVFGEQSLFQYINRTSTPNGKKHLAEWFNTHLLEKVEIEQRQEGIAELAKKLEYRQHFRLFGLLNRCKKSDKDEISEWINSPNRYQTRLLRSLPYVAGGINALCIGLSAADLIIPGSVAGTIFVCFILFSFIFSRGIAKMQTRYGEKLQILSTYADQILLTEQQEMHSPALQRLKAELTDPKNTASKALQRLNKLMNVLDQRNNMVMSSILNGLFLWELRQMTRIESWKKEHASDLIRWLEAIGEIDAYCSLATFAYNHPDYIYPEIASKPFSMEAEGMGHPLMNPKKCVCNDVEIAKRPFFIIITGANMAGKSTYLRTVGINYLLTCIGAPVWAGKMKIYPSSLVTSLRTSDSLTDNESYFFAELKRLKLIISKLETGEELFIILDEILKGTNSTDKQKGSFALIKQFMTLQANGIIATHDLLLGSLSDIYPNDIRNHCFEADITRNELTFSYQMKAGIAQNMNACFLMKKMGIAVIDD